MEKQKRKMVNFRYIPKKLQKLKVESNKLKISEKQRVWGMCVPMR